MKALKNLTFTLVCLAFISIFADVTVEAQIGAETKEKPIAVAKTVSGGLSWDVNVPYSSVVLTVASPDGEVTRQEFPLGTIPFFAFSRPDGSARIDGAYVFEISIIPNIDGRIKKMLSKARDAGTETDVLEELRKSGQLPSEPMIQSGSFAVVSGKAVAGDETEIVESKAADTH